jgi:hypothetical protein
MGQVVLTPCRFPEGEKMEPLVWIAVPKSEFEVMYNGSGELFVRHKHRDGNKEIRLTPSQNGFHISDFNTPGKLRLLHGIEVE